MDSKEAAAKAFLLTEVQICWNSFSDAKEKPPPEHWESLCPAWTPYSGHVQRKAHKHLLLSQEPPNISLIMPRVNADCITTLRFLNLPPPTLFCNFLHHHGKDSSQIDVSMQHSKHQTLPCVSSMRHMQILDYCQQLERKRHVVHNIC